MAIIALMTDFGTRDYYVPAMRGVILQINPKATIVDVSHEIDSQDLLHGAFVLRQTVPYFPIETIFVAVVDPTVGSARRILAARYNDRIVLAPDNGLMSMLHRDGKLQDMRVVENRRLFATTLSTTFHGRDIFAPVAAHLSLGVTMDLLGPPADHIEVLDVVKPAIDGEGNIDGEVLLVDHFGNLITNISMLDIANAGSQRRHYAVKVGSLDVGPIRNTYSDVAIGETVALIGSAQMLEIAVNSGNAADKLHIRRGGRVQLR